MPTQTELSGSPYFDDFDEEKNFYRILFKPSVPPQVRELNQLQTILQDQIEKFGDNVFKQGTIVDGCSFSFHDMVPFVKIKDVETDGSRTIVDDYDGHYVKNSSNLVAEVVTTAAGFESTQDKNTLFVRYINGGDDANSYAYAPDDVLTIYNPSYTLESIGVNDGSIGFSSDDSVVVLSALAVTNTTGGTAFSNSFVVGDVLTDNINANVEVVEVDDSSRPDAVLLRVKPLSADLSNDSANSTSWTIDTTQTWTATNGESGRVVEVVGSGAEAIISTDGVGSISTVTMTSLGSGYSTTPTATIKSRTATAGQIDNLDLIPRNFVGRVAVLSLGAEPTGHGYGVTVNEGVVYQKGYFVRVDPQFVIVSKYSPPDGLVAGFRTDETIINSNVDPSLLDNVLGSSNSTAPGADRLKLSAVLEVTSAASAATDPGFLSIVEFSGGQPYLQRKQTQYNVIDQEMARRTHEESGDYVVDEFLLNTRSPLDFASEVDVLDAVVDPGVGYINGHRVETSRNFILPIDKAKDTASGTVVTSLNYGSYVRVSNVGGAFKFNTADVIDLYDSPVNYTGGVPSSTGSKIGTARLRSMTHESGVAGTADAVYRIYVFEIKMEAGKNFADVRSLFYDGTIKGVGDVVTSVDPLTERVSCVLYEAKTSGLIFNNGVRATKSISDESYVYRTIDQTLTANAAGYVVFNTGVDETFPYDPGRLTTSQERDLIVVPLANGSSSANLTGTVATTAANVGVVGTGTQFLSELVPGDWITISSTVGQVSSISNNTVLTLTKPASGTSSGQAKMIFPQHVPVSLERTSRWANVSAVANQMTVCLGSALSSDVPVSVTFNVKTSGAQVDKTVHRDVFVRIDTANNVGSVAGPWSLGVPDVFRLKNVYQVDGSTNTYSINAVSAVVDDFIEAPAHRFSNGDLVTYVGGAYVIPGLSNNTAYWVYGSNSSGFQLTSDNTVAVSINAVATNDVDHTFTGRPFFFGEGGNWVEDVTDEFYIDHNQTEDYYGQSYLYRVPGTGSVDADAVLLAKFDVLTHAARGGHKHVGSYNIDDSVALADSNTTINTLEVPELYTTQDVYYDLRDAIDIRPTVGSDSNLSATNPTDYKVDPVEPTGDDRFGTTEKKFPAPESSFSANIEYYLGRVDRVVVDSDQQIRVVKGTPGSSTAPNRPVNSLTVNVLNVAPYPSIPEVLSTETEEFADTRMTNGKYLVKRLVDYRVRTMLFREDVSAEQPRVYRMTDIGQIDRRVSNLERLVALTSTEDQVKDKVIPSAIDPSLDRFKYGFFVDDFTSYDHAALDDPEYNASVLNGELVPKFNVTGLEFRFNDTRDSLSYPTKGGDFVSLPYEEYTLISQSVATDGAVSAPPPPEPEPPIVDVDVGEAGSGDPDNYYFEDWPFTFANTACLSEMFVNCSGRKTSVQVLQSKTSDGRDAKTVTTSQYAVPNIAGSADTKPGARVYRIGGETTWSNGLGFRPNGPVETGGVWIENSYRLTWTHDPKGGRYYTVRVFVGGKSSTGPALKSGAYVFKLFYPMVTTTFPPTTAPAANTAPPVVVKPPVETKPTAPAPKPPVFNWNGGLSFDRNFNPVRFQVNVPVQDLKNGVINNTDYTRLSIKIYHWPRPSLRIYAFGLKPNTRHAVFLNGSGIQSDLIVLDPNEQLILAVGTGATTFKTDSSGKASFLVFGQSGKNLRDPLQSCAVVCATDVSDKVRSNRSAYKTSVSWAEKRVEAPSVNLASGIALNGLNIRFPYLVGSILV